MTVSYNSVYKYVYKSVYSRTGPMLRFLIAHKFTRLLAMERLCRYTVRLLPIKNKKFLMIIIDSFFKDLLERFWDSLYGI